MQYPITLRYEGYIYEDDMTLFAWIVIVGSIFAAGWFARGLWDLAQLIHESNTTERN